ncbi:hypothetical protein HDU77_000451 [Chytriomyces hyalinus]|nr:hypothetical protein HDU77_000451 [Chytriomyces hyalinus]
MQSVHFEYTVVAPESTTETESSSRRVVKTVPSGWTSWPWARAFIAGLTGTERDLAAEAADASAASRNEDGDLQWLMRVASISADVAASTTAAAWALATGSFVIPYQIPFIGAPAIALEKDQDFDMSAIKSIAWHPHKPFIAVLHRLDFIFIYDLGSRGFVGKNRGMVTHAKMKNVTCLQWMPVSGTALAVGTSSGLCIWRIFPDAPSDSTHFPYATTFLPDANVMAGSAKLMRLPSLSNPSQFRTIDDQMAQPHTPVRNRIPAYNESIQNTAIPNQLPSGQSFMTHFLTHPSMLNVSSLCYSKDGKYLFAGVSHAAKIFVIDVARGVVLNVLTKIAGQGTRTLSLSPDGKYLVQLCKSKFIRIWGLETMESVDLEAWNALHFRQVAWMPDSKTLLIAMNGVGPEGRTGRVSALQMAGDGSLEFRMHPKPMFMPTIHSTDPQGRKICIGGSIKSMSLDLNGKRLSVTYENPSVPLDNYAPGRDIVVLFDVQLAPHLILAERGQIQNPGWNKNDKSSDKPPRYPKANVSGHDENPMYNPQTEEHESAFLAAPAVAGPRPLVMQFASNVNGVIGEDGRSVSGSLLAVGWENGDVAFYPVGF